MELYHPSFFERLVCAVFVESAKAFGGYIEQKMLVEFGYKDAALDEVDGAANTPGRVKLSRTHAVAVLAACLRSLLSYSACLWHNVLCMVPYTHIFASYGFDHHFRPHYPYFLNHRA